MINLACIGKNRGLVSHDTEHMPKPNSSLNLKLRVRMLQMCICTLWMMPATRFTALGQHKYRPTTNHAGLVTHRDLLVHARSWRNAGTQVVLVLFDLSSLIHLAPIPAKTCLPTASQPSLLSLAINTKTCMSIFYFLDSHHFSCPLRLNIPASSSLPSIQSLAYFLFVQLALQLPGRIFGCSSPVICLLVISPALPTSQTYPCPCL